MNTFKNKILRHEPDGDAHLVDANGVRHWIPDGGVYECLVARGHAVVDTRWRQYIDDTPEGGWAACS